MEIKEAYQILKCNYDEVYSRFGSEGLVKRFALKFLNDESFAQLKEALETKDAEKAFRLAHTLKGICQNLGLGTLYKSSYSVTEALRDGKNDVTDEMLSKLKDDYKMTVSTIESL